MFANVLFTNVKYFTYLCGVKISDKTIVIYGDLNQPIYDNLFNEKIDVTLPKWIYLVKI